MKILDTNVVSELTRPIPNTSVLEWVARQPPEGLYITAITEAELRFGVELLYPRRRRSELEAAILRMIDTCCRAHPSIQEQCCHSLRRNTRCSPKELDCMIAAIARVNGTAVATRNVSNFENCGVEVVNPWLD